MAAELPHIDRELADRLAGVEQIEDAVARGDAADVGRRIDEPASPGHVRDRDQLRARTDCALEGGEVELPGRVAVDHVDLDPHARLHLQEREVVRQILGPRGDDAVARPERNRVERHVPGARGVLDERDLVRAGADQRGDGVVDICDAIGGFGRSLVAADGGLAMQMAGDRVNDRPGWQGGAGVVEVKDGVDTRRVRPEICDVEHAWPLSQGCG